MPRFDWCEYFRGGDGTMRESGRDGVRHYKGESQMDMLQREKNDALNTIGVYKKELVEANYHIKSLKEQNSMLLSECEQRMDKADVVTKKLEEELKYQQLRIGDTFRGELCEQDRKWRSQKVEIKRLRALLQLYLEERQ